jgi:hypothetical protein
MTAAEELALLEPVYAAWIQAGMPQSYTTGDGRTFTRPAMNLITDRIDQLRAVVSSGSSSGFYVASPRLD